MPVSPTSAAAHRSIEYIKGRQQRAILYLLQSIPKGLTREEISRQLHLRIQSVCGRCRELMDLGMIGVKPLDTPAGKIMFETRPTVSGRPAAVLSWLNKREEPSEWTALQVL